MPAPRPAPQAQQQPAAEPEPALPPAVASTRGSAMDIDGPAPQAHGLPLAAAGVGGLAARLESLKRESVRPSLAGHQVGVQFEAAPPLDAQALTKLAIQLFDDEPFRQLCDKGLTQQLTRSKDGATGAFSGLGADGMEWMGSLS